MLPAPSIIILFRNLCVDTVIHAAHIAGIPEQPDRETTMQPYAHFQRATCQIAEGDRLAAIRSIDAAIRKIDRNGTDAHMRPDLAKLRAAVLANASAKGA